MMTEGSPFQEPPKQHFRIFLGVKNPHFCWWNLNFSFSSQHFGWSNTLIYIFIHHHLLNHPSIFQYIYSLWISNTTLIFGMMITGRTKKFFVQWFTSSLFSHRNCSRFLFSHVVWLIISGGHRIPPRTWSVATMPPRRSSPIAASAAWTVSWTNRCAGRGDDGDGDVNVMIYVHIYIYIYALCIYTYTYIYIYVYMCAYIHRYVIWYIMIQVTYLCIDLYAMCLVCFPLVSHCLD